MWFLCSPVSADNVEWRADAESKRMSLGTLDGHPLSVEIRSQSAMTGYSETMVTTRWQPANRSAVEQQLFFAMCARKVRVTRERDNVLLHSECGMYDDFKTTEVWAWKSAKRKFVKRREIVVSSYREQARVIEKHIDRGEMDAAIRGLDELTTSHDGNSDHTYWWYMRMLTGVVAVADKHARAGRHDRAADVLDRMLAATRRWEIAHVENISTADPRRFPCCEQNRKPAASTERVRKRNVRTLNEAGYHLLNGNRLERAIALLTWVVKLSPERDVAYINLGDALWKHGRKDDARARYQSYVSLRQAKGKFVPERVRTRLGTRKQP